MIYLQKLAPNISRMSWDYEKIQSTLMDYWCTWWWQVFP